MDTLVHKIFRPLSRADKQKVEQHVRAADRAAPGAAMQAVARLVAERIPAASGGDDAGEGKADFVAENLARFLQKGRGVGADTRFVDVGGGNGDVLAALQRRLGGPPENYVCVETRTDWVDAPYPFSHSNITYCFWDNQAMPDLPDESADVVLCMVALHHMPRSVQRAAVGEMARVLRPGGRWLVKEHDASDARTLDFIEWEHHLYHIMDCVRHGVPLRAEEYLARSVHVFLPKEAWARLFREHGLAKEGAYHNRFLDGTWAWDARNRSNLFWMSGTKARDQAPAEPPSAA
jgi:ubiquinone/menaquinone biosynthesis C-methylase UbiE